MEGRSFSRQDEQEDTLYDSPSWQRNEVIAHLRDGKSETKETEMARWRCGRHERHNLAQQSKGRSEHATSLLSFQGILAILTSLFSTARLAKAKVCARPPPTTRSAITVAYASWLFHIRPRRNIHALDVCVVCVKVRFHPFLPAPTPHFRMRQ
jgi:hypothetical protein